MEHINAFKAAIAAVCAALTTLWGWFGWLVVAWVVCMLHRLCRRPPGRRMVK